MTATSEPVQLQARTSAAAPAGDQAERIGFDIPTWCRAAGIGVSTEKVLADECRPRSVKILSRRIIVEPPREWLERMAALGGAYRKGAGPKAAA